MKTSLGLRREISLVAVLAGISVAAVCCLPVAGRVRFRRFPDTDRRACFLFSHCRSLLILLDSNG